MSLTLRCNYRFSSKLVELIYLAIIQPKPTAGSAGIDSDTIVYHLIHLCHATRTDEYLVITKTYFLPEE